MPTLPQAQPPAAARRPARSRYRRLRRFAVVVLVVEFVVGMVGFLTPRGEIFPLASWFLFLLVPHDTVDYDLILHANNGNPIEPPKPYSQLSWLVAMPHSIVTYQLVQGLGEADARHDEARVRTLRRQVEQLFMQPRVEYDLVRNTYQPVERWKTGTVRARRTLRSFTAGEP